MNKRDSIRIKEIKNLIIMILIILIIGIFSLAFYIIRDKKQYLIYNEMADIDYRVYLNDNDFYKDNYNEDGPGYIADMIKEVTTKFKYKLNFSNQVQYSYSYRIVVEVDLEDEKNENSIYHFSEELVNKRFSSKIGNLNIQEKLSFDYNHYNDLVSKFKDVYDLENTTSNLNLYLYVTVKNIGHDKSVVLDDKKVSTLSIPLTENSVSIDVDTSTISNSNQRILLISKTDYTWVLVLSFIYLIISLIYIVYLVGYTRKGRAAKMIYSKEIKNIMSNYDSYIQKIDDSYDIDSSQVLKVDSFNDMLEIHDTLKQSILMLENDEKTGTFFIIPATNNIIYTYALRVLDIQAKMDGREVPTYDITEIPQLKFKKNKKYTDKFIKEQLTITSSLPVIDENKVIEGSKDNSNNLYEQLEKTAEFDIKKIRKAKKSIEKLKKGMKTTRIKRKK